MRGNGSCRMVKQIKAIFWTRRSQWNAGNIISSPMKTTTAGDRILRSKRLGVSTGGQLYQVVMLVAWHPQWQTTTFLTQTYPLFLRVVWSVQSVEASQLCELKMLSPVGDVFISEEMMLSNNVWCSSCSEYGLDLFNHSTRTIHSNSKTVLFLE